MISKSYLSDKVKNVLVKDCICSPGHSRFFLENSEIIGQILNDYSFIQNNGLSKYLDRHYFCGNQTIIINIIGEKYYIVDGNRHLLAALLWNPNVKLGDFEPFLRVWKKGCEYAGPDSFINESPYDVFIPDDVDYIAIENSGVHINRIRDNFKSELSFAIVIPANIEFDCSLFNDKDKGQPMEKLMIDFGKIQNNHPEIVVTRDNHTSSKSTIEYEVLGTFNEWGARGDPFDYRFKTEKQIHLKENVEFKVHKCNSPTWYGCGDVKFDGTAHCFSRRNDNYGGWNIYVLEETTYSITIDDLGTVRISKSTS